MQFEREVELNSLNLDFVYSFSMNVMLSLILKGFRNGIVSLGCGGIFVAGNFIATGVFVSLRAVVRGQGDPASPVQAEL